MTEENIWIICAILWIVALTCITTMMIIKILKPITPGDVVDKSSIRRLAEQLKGGVG